MPEQTFQLHGQVIDQAKRQGIPRLRVEAWDRDKKRDDVLGQTNTDAEGYFTIRFTDSIFSDDGTDALPDVYVKIFNGKNVVHNTEAQPIKNWTSQHAPLVIEVNMESTLEAKPYLVAGRILNFDGPPVMGAEVHALHKNLRSEILLGKQRVDDFGRYNIRYSPPDGAKEVDLIVRAIRPETDAKLATSDLICHARKIEAVDLFIGGSQYRGYSEYERISRAVEQYLDGAMLGELTISDIELLQCKVQQNPIHLAYLVIAHRYAQMTQTPAAAYYGFFRMKLPTKLPALVSQQPRVQQRALEDALEANIIPGLLKDKINEILLQLKQTAVNLALETPEGQESISLAPLLSVSGLTAAQQSVVLTRYSLHQGTIQEFWASLKTDPDLGQPELIEGLQFTLQIGALAGGYVPFVEKLQERRNAGQFNAVQDLVELQHGDWLALVEVTGTPPGTPGKTEDERAENYAKMMEQTIELAFPTLSIVAGLKRVNSPKQNDLLQFFDNNPDFSFENNVDRYLKEKGEAAGSGIADVVETARQLKQLQRVYNVSPQVGRFNTMSALLGAGLDSAQAVVHMGQDSFVKSLSGPLGGEAAAKEVYAKAAQTDALATAVFGQYSTALGIGTPAVIRNITTDGINVPDWESLFGSLSFCECEECRSVYSPAAYLVDLLQFVKQQPAISIVGGVVTYPTVTLPDGTTRPKNALDELFERRSDIGEIQLSCQNTNTTLPYIDLVNEVLENAVVRQVVTYQTTWTEEELSANPEHQNETAYDRLARQVYPRLLPFNLWLEEARTYLGHLGVSLAELMEVLHRPGRTGDALAELERRIAIESVGLSPFESRIITGTLEPARDPWEFWGIESADWPDSLAELPTFLGQAEIDYTTLEALRKTGFINSDGRLTVKVITPCNTEGATINNLTEAVLDRIHRFLRLQQAIKWEISELDAAIAAMKATDLTMSFLVQASQIERLRSELYRPLLEMLSWWSTISTVVDETDPEDRSFYDELFLNKAAINPVDEAFQLNSARSDLLNAGSAPLGEHKPAIIAALAITEADLALILNQIGKTESDGLTLELLSELYRHASFPKALDLSVSEFLSVRNLTNIDPFASPRAALDFVAGTETIGQSKFSIETLDYLLRHVYSETSGLAPTESSIILTLDGIKAGLQTIAAENVFAADPTGEIMRGQLALLLTGDDLGTAIAIIEGTSTLALPDQEAFIDEHFAVFLGDTTNAKALLTRPIDPENAEKQIQARYEYVLQPLVAYLRTTLGTQLVVQTIASALGLETAVSESLLTGYVTAPNDPSRRAIDLILGIDLEATTYAELELNTYRLLHKIATILTTLGATSEELDWIFGKRPVHKPRGARLNLSRLLPLGTVTGAEAAEHYAGWKRLIALYDFRDRYPVAGDVTVFSLLDLVDSGSDRDSLLEALGSLTGWNPDDLDYLTGSDGFGLAYPSDYGDERYLAHLQAAFDLLRPIGVSAEAVGGWKVTDNLEEMKTVATAIKSAVKAKYDNETWLGIAEPLKNQLRELQRSALLAYLIARRPKFHEASELFDHYLIDVEMNACMKTSRIKQAIGSVQLFVQRSLMNLEPNVEIAESAAGQWDWMKNYRVWEANRKIFLYPENWIVPELRDDKSPFFMELENDLLQNEITSETSETALLNYLGKLDEVANLDVRALYHQKEGGELPTDILHVFARTYSTPHVYYYRRYVDSASWTPWERLDIDIEEDHLLAIVWNRRLYLIWPLIEEETGGSESCTPLSQLFENEFPRLLNDQNVDAWEDLKSGWMDTYYEPTLEEQLQSQETDLEEQTDWLEEFFSNAFPNISFDNIGSVLEEWWDCKSTDNKVSNVQLAWAEYKDGTWTAEKSDEGTLSILYRSKESFLLKAEIEQPVLQRFPLPVNNLSDVIFTPVTESHDLIITCYSSDGLSKTPHGSFRFTGCNGKVVVTTFEDEPLSPTHLFPTSLSSVNMQLVEDEGVDVPLMIPLSTVNSAGDWTGDPTIDYLTALNKTPGQFTLALPEQYNEYVSQDDLFYEDETRCFHIMPGEQFGLFSVFQSTDSVYFEAALRSTRVGPETPQNGRFRSNHRQLDALRRPAPRTGKQIVAGGQQSPDFMDTYGDVIEGLLDTSGSVAGGLQVGSATTIAPEKVYRFASFYHPHVCTFFEELNATGIDGLMQRSIQARSSEFFGSTYDPNEEVVPQPYPLMNVDFSSPGAYSPYNWELFFHAPLLIATRLSANQQFEEAQKWFHYIFDPMARMEPASVTGPERYWNFLPFYEENRPQTIDELMLELNEGDAELEAQVGAWRMNPFNPHLIARMRPIAYQKTVVMKYLDNLIAWGDSLFSQDTIESINEATQLYILAGKILGPRPQSLPAAGLEDSETYNSIADKLDAFSNALVQIENQIPIIRDPLFDPLKDPFTPNSIALPRPSPVPLPHVETLYFCVPKNDQLCAYWDTVADRLFKIRNCMNIEGVVRELALFEPPIDPMLLVQAAAAGIDISSALSNLYAPLPCYRFQFMFQKAMEFCADVRSLGAALLSALEKKDAEALALLRASHEKQLLESIKEAREKEVDEANENLNGLTKAREVAETRLNYYQQLISIGLNPGEILNLDQLIIAQTFESKAGEYELRAARNYRIPDVSVSFTPTWPPIPQSVGTSIGGSFLGNNARARAAKQHNSASSVSFQASLSSITAGYDRRQQEWQQQFDLAQKEIDQIDKQIAAAQLRVAIAENGLDSHNQQIEHAQEVQDFMTNKYTNDQLYSWMVSQISGIYFQSYQMAYDLAKRAEKAYQHELGVSISNFISFGYWDSLKKGLISGEKLQYDLRRMEMSYLEQNKREYEITKHVSLAMLDPVALIQLRETGKCFISLPEALFDLDHPGHYLRRIKHVSVTVPCVTGPYTGVNCTLTLMKSSIREDNTLLNGQYARDVENEDLRFNDSFGAIQSIVTSSGQNDPGLFEANLRDERYLPFEGAGVISDWSIEMPGDFRAFDYETISDLILHLHYTAREAGGSLKTEAVKELQEAINTIARTENDEGLARYFSMRREFSTEWYRFLHPPDATSLNTLKLTFTKDRFPFLFQGKKISIDEIEIYVKVKPEFETTHNETTLTLTLEEGAPPTATEMNIDVWNGLLHARKENLSWDVPVVTSEGEWTLTAVRNTTERLDPNALADIFVVCNYSLSIAKTLSCS